MKITKAKVEASRRTLKAADRIKKNTVSLGQGQINFF